MKETLANGANLWTTWIQLGFAGFSLVLLAFLFWIVRRFLKAGDKMTTVQMEYTVQLTRNTDVTRELSSAVRSLSDKLTPVEQCPLKDANQCPLKEEVVGTFRALKTGG